MRLDLPRILALGLAGLIMAWQFVNAARGRFVHDFLIADLIVAAALAACAWGRPTRPADARLAAAFGATAGVFLAATTAGLLTGGYDLGRALTSLGLVPCLVAIAALARRAGQDG